ASGTVLTYLQGAWMIDEAIHDLVFHPAITVAATQLLGTPRVRFWHDQVFAKPPRQGGNVAWHQDYSYWRRTTPSQHLTFWIGLDDSTLANGCLHVVPGSHRWGLLEMEDLMGDMDRLKRQLPPERAAAFTPRPLEQPAGTCSIHHDHTIHGSYRNESDRPRRAIVLNYMADGTRSDADDGVLMDGFNKVAKGEIIRGRLFPLAIDLEALPA
nr:phytanoyl-CoA dioxygenase family protein [Planctomycetota bacterium]